ncbi:MAG TPA: amino acid permease [Mycobacteriales bacterium]|nr:amino acid permease [Mycobacteriales bacterium]
MDDAARPLPIDVSLPERLSYRVKRRLLGPPLVTDQLVEQRLANPVAFGVLSPDCISSSAYGTEEMLIGLLPYAGFAAFTLVLPLTGVILVILMLLLFSYRQVLSVYTKAGGSYVVARDNFGPRVAQIAAVALLIDYVVTVSIQTAAGSAAVVSAVPSIGNHFDHHGTLVLSLIVIALLFWGNLRGIREAGRAFAVPLYFFITMASAVIIICIAREITGHLIVFSVHNHLSAKGIYPIRKRNGFIEGATLLVLARSFANGGSSLTGFEAISNGVGAFRPPEGRNARKVLLIMACTLGFLVGGVSWVAHLTHATPYVSGYPTVISQEARAAFGYGGLGNVLFYVVQAATALILYTGGNTSFNGFPFLANFVAEDRFLPRQLTRRGHRLVFSNAIVVLAAVSTALLLVTDATVNKLVPFYAIGVFTGFAMAGYGMAKHFSKTKEGNWRRSIAINMTSGVVSTIVVAIFAIAKFTEGAWVIVILFPALVFVLIRLNREYREEAEVLGSIQPEVLSCPPNFTRHVVLIFVNELDLAVIGAIRYGQTLKATELRAVHFNLDSTAAHQLEQQWEQTAQSIPLEIVDTPDRRLGRAALELVLRETSVPGTHVTVLLPRRGFAPALGRLLHDRTADKIAAVISRLPNAAATIVPFDTSRPDRAVLSVGGAVRPKRMKAPRTPKAPGTAPTTGERAVPAGGNGAAAPDIDLNRMLADDLAPGPDPIGTLGARQPAVIHGRIRSVRLKPLADSPMLVCEVVDATGGLELLFYGRRSIPGMKAGATITATGRTMSHHGRLAMANPRYQLKPASHHAAST